MHSLRQYSKQTGEPRKSGLHAESSVSTSVVVKQDLNNLMHNEQHVYYDLFLSNQTDRRIKAKFVDTRSVPLISIPSDYKLSVVRLQADLKDIGMFRISNRVLTVTLYYAPDNLVATQQLFLGRPQDFRIFDFNEIVYGYFGINQSILAAYNNIVAQYEAIYGPGSWAASSGAGQQPPGVVYDEDNNFFKFYTPIENEDSLATGLQLYLNRELAFLMDSANLDFANENYSGNNNPNLFPDNVKVIFLQSYQNNNVTTFPQSADPAQLFIENTQVWQTVERWWKARKLLIVSSSIGSRPEFIASTDSQGRNINYSILTDVQLNFNTDNFSPGTSIRYQPLEYRIIDITKDSPLNNIEFNFLIQDVDGSVQDLQLFPGDAVTMKVMFIKSLTA